MIVLEAAGIVLMLVGIALLIFRFQKSESGTDKKGYTHEHQDDSGCFKNDHKTTPAPR